MRAYDARNFKTRRRPQCGNRQGGQGQGAQYGQSSMLSPEGGNRTVHDRIGACSGWKKKNAQRAKHRHKRQQSTAGMRHPGISIHRRAMSPHRHLSRIDTPNVALSVVGHPDRTKTKTDRVRFRIVTVLVNHFIFDRINPRHRSSTHRHP